MKHNIKVYFVSYIIIIIVVSLQGRLVDLINLFGELGGFDRLYRRVCEKGDLSVPVLSYILKLVC